MVEINYQQGFGAGSRAEDAPRLQPTRTGLALSRAFGAASGIGKEDRSFRSGYIDGLNDFVAEHKLAHTILFKEPAKVLNEDGALQGYLWGLRRENPNVVRIYGVGRFTNTKQINYINSNLEPNYPLAALHRMLGGEGYKLGFCVGMIRDYEITPGILEIPVDNTAYNAFMAGLEAEPKSLPDIAGDKNIYVKDIDTTVQYRTYEKIDDILYQAGLRAWLHTQGVVNVPTWAIRHPEALEAFKAGLDGKESPEYRRGQPIIISKDPGKQIMVGEKDFSLNISYVNKEILFKLDNDSLSNPVEEVSRQTRLAYQLGFKARKSK